MQVEMKQTIATAAKGYMDENKMTAADFAKQTKVNQSYLSNILNGQFTAAAGDNAQTEIKDTYFIRIAEVVGVKMEKSYWDFIMTKEFQEVAALLQEAKDNGIAKTIICETGGGKSYCIAKFKIKNPVHTYVLKLDNLVRISDIFTELGLILNVPEKGTRAWRRGQIVIKLRDIRRAGGHPIIIFDEGENMSAELMKMLKGLYDGIEGYASLVLIGTDQLLRKMEGNKRRDKDAAPQFYRRFKAGIKVVHVLSRATRFKPFFEHYSLPTGLRKLLLEICENYGELHDYLEPFFRECDERGWEVNEDNFRLKYDMPAE